MKLFVKNLTQKEDEAAVAGILQQLNIEFDPEITLGEISLSHRTSTSQLTELKTRLQLKDYQVIYDRKEVLAEQVKLAVCAMLDEPELPKVNYSIYLSNRLHLNYTYLANIFSEVKGITIEHFIINQKIEKAKNLMVNDRYNISEAAHKLHYSSIGHFSNQFKKVTGQSPSEFRKNCTGINFSDPLCP